MKVETSGAAADVEAGLLAVPLFQEDLAARDGLVGALDARLEGHLAAAARDERFEGKPAQALAVHTVGRLPALRVLLLGLGPRSGAGALAASGFEALRMAAGTAGRAAVQTGVERFAVALPAGVEVVPAARAVAEGALLGAYRFDRYKTEKDGGPGPRALVVAAADGAAPALRGALEEAARTAAAVAWARDLVNEAPMHCTPSRLARAAEELARRAGLKCQVRGPREIAALKMGMFLGVARGSVEEPRLVKVSYVPRGEGAAAAPLVLVGKAITFDSGGLSLKPTESMVTMNTDMAGSAAVLAAMELIAELAPPFPVHALLGACENMPGGRAYKPSDVLTAYDGKTVEITNTDAEGRLVLGDVLAWGVDALAPAAIIDVATLTGACIVALGQYTVGAFGPDGSAMDAVLAAARAAGEDVWRMPLTPAVKDTLKSDVADMKNTGDRWGGAISAAHFLHAFVGETPWVHLDIAGPSHSAKERGYVAKGGTGVAVRTLFELARAWRPPGGAAGQRARAPGMAGRSGARAARAAARGRARR